MAWQTNQLTIARELGGLRKFVAAECRHQQAESLRSPESEIALAAIPL
jgi:hypothetical protein